MPRLMVLALAVYSYLTIKSSIPHLPARIPTHFNGAGEPTGWSSPTSLWVLLAAQVFGGALILAIPYLGRRLPQTVNLGRRRLSDLLPEQRERVMPLLENMCGSLSFLFSLLLTLVIRDLIRVALSPGARPQFWPIGIFLAGFVAVTIYHLRRINRVAEETSSGGCSPWPP